MHITEHALIGAAARLPSSDPQPVVSFSPVVIPFADRTHDLQMRVVAPVKGDNLPVVIISHGHGPYFHLSSLEGYTPLAEFWAARGFVVIQPTHLSSKTLGLSLEGDELKKLMLTDRTKDISRVLDKLDVIERAVPLLQGRIDKKNVALAGHSLGGFTTQVVLGATNTDPYDGSKFSGYDERIKAGIIIGGTGTGGSDLSENAMKWFRFYDIDFSNMRTPALVVWGEIDVSPHLTTRDAEWHNDPYRLSPGPKSSLMIKNGHHAFGGISGWDATAVRGDESPEMLGMVQKMTLAYLRSQLYGDKSWIKATEALREVPELGSVEEKS